MELRDEISKIFVYRHEIGVWPLESLPKEYPAWIFDFDTEYGAAIKLPKEIDIDESFSSIKLRCNCKNFDGSGHFPYLMLTCTLDSEEYYDNFASICSDFLDTAENGSKRLKLMSDPFAWWEKWKKLVGNVDRSKEPYSVIAELISLESMLKYGESAIWEGPDKGTVDIRGTKFDCEVKSSISRKSNEITISSENQLNPGDRNLHLYYCSFEKSESGVSIDDMVDRLTKLNQDKDELESKLCRLGLPKGRSVRKWKYHLLQFRDYTVDKSFPKITDSSFIDGKRPKGIKSIMYTVSLDDLEYRNIEFH